MGAFLANNLSLLKQEFIERAMASSQQGHSPPPPSHRRQPFYPFLPGIPKS